MRARGTLLIVLVLLSAGCIAGNQDNVEPAATAADGTVTSVFERGTMPFVLDDEFSRTLQKGLYDILPVESIFVDVVLPITEGGSAADGSAKVHMGLWLPDVPAGTKVPVIADIGPYYSDGDLPAIEPARRLGAFLIENFVPHGYAVAQVSVFGSGESTHCMDLMGMSEQLGVDAAVTYLGTQEWSNGAVGLIGRSYDGSTPWEAATFGNPALKTIVPISGLIGSHELMWRNGSAETRGPIMHNGVYGTFGIDGVKVDPFAVFGDSATGAVSADPNAAGGDVYTACKDYMVGPAQGAGAYATGDHFVPEVNDYWKERNFLPRTLENYKGSVYLIHGLQDWNVDNHMAFPTYHKLEDAGLEVKGLFGQWAHMYPDRASEHENLPPGRGGEAYPASVRVDWAQDLLEWFNYYLKGTGAKPLLQAEVQDITGAWRVEQSYPPRDAMWVDIGFDTMTASGSLPVTGGPSGVGPAPSTARTYKIPALSDTMDVRIAGQPQLHVKVTPTGPGGQLFAELRDTETGMRLGHAIMDLRFASGGDRMQPVVPGMPIVAKMEFFAFDAPLPAGHGLTLIIRGTGEDYLPSVVSAPVIIDDTAASVLRVPTVERAADVFFTLPAPTAVANVDDNPA